MHCFCVPISDSDRPSITLQTIDAFTTSCMHTDHPSRFLQDHPFFRQQKRLFHLCKAILVQQVLENLLIEDGLQLLHCKRFPTPPAHVSLYGVQYSLNTNNLHTTSKTNKLPKERKDFKNHCHRPVLSVSLLLRFREFLESYIIVTVVLSNLIASFAQVKKSTIYKYLDED